MAINYDKLEANVYRALEKYGAEMDFYHKVDGEKNDVTGAIDYTTLVTKVRGISNNFSNIFITGDLIQKGDKEIIISMRQGRPSLGDEIKIGDTFFRVINVQGLTPADKTLLYRLHVRSYAVGEDIDRLFVDLKDLQLGSKVMDPNRQNTPIWRVIAHNHHSAGLTTLITDEVWDIISFNGQVEVGGAYPTKPWTMTFMRRWLQNEFTKVLSAKMIANLQGAIVTTADERVTDSVTILSKTEIGGGITPGVNNGKVMPYFEADSFRIAIYDDPKRNTDVSTEYWTRDAWGVGADGKLKTFNPSYVHGVRPVIFLRGGLSTALNFNGEYEIQFE